MNSVRSRASSANINATESGAEMSIVRTVKRAVKAAIPPLLFLSLTAYFGWSATQGDHGLGVLAERHRLLQQAEAERAAAEAEQQTWERRVAALGSHLDRDMLDERARAMLNLADPNDIVIPYGAKDRLY